MRDNGHHSVLKEGTPMKVFHLPVLLSSFVLLLASSVNAHLEAHSLKLEDVFELEYAADPQISPDGTRAA
jgi:hypothetical protein